MSEASSPEDGLWLDRTARSRLAAEGLVERAEGDAERDPDLPADGDEDATVEIALDALGAQGDLETLRDEFVDAFNARDVDALLALVADDVDCPDVPGPGGAAVLMEELEAVWERSPTAILTRGFVEATPCAVAWLPDEDGDWIRVGLVCFDCDEAAITLVALPDDADALWRAEAEDPGGDELDEWSDWAEWERGEETTGRPRAQRA